MHEEEVYFPLTLTPSWGRGNNGAPFWANWVFLTVRHGRATHPCIMKMITLLPTFSRILPFRPTREILALLDGARRFLTSVRNDREKHVMFLEGHYSPNVGIFELTSYFLTSSSWPSGPLMHHENGGRHRRGLS